MDSGELLKRAWEMVSESGVPESLQEAAFKEAVQLLKEQEGLSPAPAASVASPALPRASTARSASTRKGSVPDFFKKVEHETGVSVDDLMSILVLDESVDPATVQVATPTRSLGSAKAEQSRSVVALVAGARHAGMDEDPVPGSAVRDECKRKKCYDENNFSAKAVGPMKGFNLHNRDIKPTAKWVDEFVAAVSKVLGEEPAAKA